MDRADFRLLGVWVAIVAGATACGDPIDLRPTDASPGTTDGTVGPVPDAGTSGLRVRFSSVPRIPGDFQIAGADDDDIAGQIERVDVDLRTLRVNGDVGMVQVPALDLRFRSEAEQFDASFGRAPPGIYGTFAAEIVAVDVRGSLEIGDDEFEFRITDVLPQGLNVSTSIGTVELDAGELADVGIRLDIDGVVTAIDWENVDEDDGELHVDASDPQIDVVRAAFTTGLGPT